MAAASVSNTFVNSTPADAAEVNTNFGNLVTFLNNSVVHRDGSKSMTGNFDAGTNRVVNVSAATAAADAPRWDQAGVAGYEATSAGVVLPASDSVVADTISVTVPTAGMCLVVVTGDFTYAGTNTVGLGEKDPILVTVTGGVFAVPLVGNPVPGEFATIPAGTGTVTENRAVVLVGLAAGANTLSVSMSRTASGGTVTFSSGFKTVIVGGF